MPGRFRKIVGTIEPGTRVRWMSRERSVSCQTRGSDSRDVEYSGVVARFGFAELPWRLYFIREDSTGRMARVHPDRIKEVVRD